MELCPDIKKLGRKQARSGAHEMKKLVLLIGFTLRRSPSNESSSKSINAGAAKMRISHPLGLDKTLPGVQVSARARKPGIMRAVRPKRASTTTISLLPANRAKLEKHAFRSLGSIAMIAWQRVEAGVLREKGKSFARVHYAEHISWAPKCYSNSSIAAASEERFQLTHAMIEIRLIPSLDLCVLHG
jgi:hypothetical protein